MCWALNRASETYPCQHRPEYTGLALPAALNPGRTRSWHPACFKGEPTEAAPRSSLERETAGWLPNTLVCLLKQGSHLLMKHRCHLSKLQVFAYVHFMQKACGRKIWRKQQTDAGTEISELPEADCGCAPRECASVLNFTKDLFLPRVLQIHRASWVGKGTR